MRIVALTATTLLLASSAIIYPAVAQDKANPSAQPQTNNETVGRDWKAKPSEDQTVGNASGKSPDSANHNDTNKVERDWRVKPDGK